MYTVYMDIALGITMEQLAVQREMQNTEGRFRQKCRNVGFEYIHTVCKMIALWEHDSPKMRVVRVTARFLSFGSAYSRPSNLSSKPSTLSFSFDFYV